MLRLPHFEYHAPTTLDAAVRLLSELHAAGESVKVIAGGTDLLPNMKHELTTPRHLIALSKLGLDGIELGTELGVELAATGSVVRVGAMTSIQTVADAPVIRARLPAVAEACAQIAGPQLRHMGTLGGNLCLDARCLYVNQTYFWRAALGFCIKKDGSVCHVVRGGRRCVAAASNDSAPPLLLYGACVVLHSVRAVRRVPLGDFYVPDGVANTCLQPDEILTHVEIPTPAAGVRCAFEKLRLRRAIDFSLLHAAVWRESDAAGVTQHLRAVVSVLGAKPKLLNFDADARGSQLDAGIVDRVAQRAAHACRPLTNVATPPAWRQAMVPVLMRRALARV